MNKHNIIPLIGLDNIKFGCSRNKIKDTYGEPTEIDTFQYDEDDDEGLSETWHYDELEVSFSFDEEDNWMLTSISTSAENFTIAGHSVIGIDKSQLEKILKKINAKIVEFDDENDVLSAIDIQTNFWFEEGKVSEVQWNVDWDDDDNPVWP